MLDVSENHLFGEIPKAIGECISLEYLYLQSNSFNGTIPSSFASLKGLRYLDLSRNRLSGSIPDVMQNISVLEHLNVSFNMLEGEVPTNGVFGNATQVEMIGNNKLCGGISLMHLPNCPIKGTKHRKHHKFMLIAVIVSVVSFLLILSFIITMYVMRKRNQNRSFDPPTIDQLAKVSYQELHQGTDGFSPTNLIGSGSFGFVYKAKFVSEDHVVAVKVLNLQKKGAHKSFIVECNALKNIRHRNLVKILTCCSSTDYKGQEFKALVFDYMKNGSLEQWLHPEILNAEPPTTLSLGQRLNVIIDVADALHYLHQECEQFIIHCDLKPNNVLLDDDMVAHVSDFGIARLVSAIGGSSQKDTSTTGIKGTVGYAPPEYGMGSEVSTCGDMYSFGILVLEMLTGRRPIDNAFEDGQNLHNFVAISFPDNLMKILDPHLVSRDVEVAIQDGSRENLVPTIEECLVSLFRIGIICSMESLKERMDIANVTRELSKIKKIFLTG
ncbi:putative LRR receptor serine/threonine-protein kinase [Trifolium repens]|nr:putative LRR receptor serine/threonine-protein kinase [Trifolium repens]